MRVLPNKRIVFSGINITRGGPLTMLHAFFAYAQDHLKEYELIFLLQDKNLLPAGDHRVIEFPKAQRTLLHKLYYEYFGFRKLSRTLNAQLWFSLNDMSPCVTSAIQCAYFHNATPFYRVSWLDFRFPSRVIFQKLYYFFFYRINIFSNRYVVVQQQFLKDYVARRMGFPAERILINRPEIATKNQVVNVPPNVDGLKVFSYTTKPEVYKNVHLIVQAAEILVREGIHDFLVKITFSGDENGYSRYIKQIAKPFPQIHLVGHLPYADLQSMLATTDCILFPSLLESWGLPLTEGMLLQKPIIAADLPYARETLWGYRNVTYTDPGEARSMARAMKNFILQEQIHTETTRETAFPGNLSLDELFKKILRSQ